MIPLLSKNKRFQREEGPLFLGKRWTTIHFSFSKTQEALGNYFKTSVTLTEWRQPELKPQEDHDRTI